MLNSSAVAQQIARGLASSGVTEVVIAPGSRSAPLIYALVPLAEAGVIRTHVRIDERDAGFLALGLARGLRNKAAGAAGGAAGIGGAAGAGGAGGAVALVTTSGSAVANLHPAVLEASYGHLPLVAITADRPARMRGTGANQTIDDQSQVLSDVRARVDVPAGSADAQHLLAEAVELSLGTDTGKAGPIQFNVQFDVPLVPTVTEFADWKATVQTLAAESADSVDLAGTVETADSVETVESAADAARRATNALRSTSVRILPGTVIVAGDAGGHSAQALKSLAEAYAIPVLAEPSSPLTPVLRNSPVAVPAHARVLSEREDLRTAIRTAIVHGKPTLTRPVAALLADSEVLVQRLPDDVDAVSLSVSFSEPEVKESSDSTLHGDRVGGEDSASDTFSRASEDTTWRDEWVNAGEAIIAGSRHEREHAAVSKPTTARAITEHLAGRTINLFAASSNTIRYLSEATDVRARVHASRGLAGIDGLISTATGLSLALEEQVVLVIGDVAMLHDVGGLLTPSAEEAGNVLIVVLNDDGGAIFSGLEHSQEHVAPYLERYFTVPHGRDFSDLAIAYGWEYSWVGSQDEPSLLNDFIAEFEKAVCGVEDDKAAANPQTRATQTRTLGRRIIEVDLT
ncbi:thiamine pyrophosphate-binding protein [Brevibacterium sp. UCMA 11754]|uniref:thiamine pyrophosphate-binding protein n=1 Tax=Brevibacterium sp. UCMA 11754 TaxID=2749198 RepID=UPI001F1E0742|nr:thiamine pyrophosphate-binding protein [Brevibacterium sp. UCMA 11754]